MLQNQHQAQKIKVLLVEDDPYCIQLYEDVFSLEPGYELQIIENLKDLSKDFLKIKKIKPDVILLDLVLPLMPAPQEKRTSYVLDKELGFQVLEELKKDPETKKIPVIIISALGGPEDKDRAQALGAEKYLVKSEITPSQIISAIQEVLR